MTLFQETGIRCPENWYFTYEVCADNGYGYKLGEYEQFNNPVIVEEMRAVTSGLRAAEPHHTTLKTIIDQLVHDGDEAEWMDYLTEYLEEVNYTCKGDF